MSLADDIAAEFLCRKTIMKLFHCLDRREYQELIELFLPNGIWHRAGTVHHGRAQIMEGMNKRSATYKIRHVLSNFLILSENKSLLEAEFYLTAFASDDGKPPKLPIQISTPHSVLVANVKLQPFELTYQISELKLSTEFIF